MPILRRQHDPRTLLLGYCTNVEPTPDLEALERAIDGLWARVRAAASPSRPMGLGLWLPAPVAAELARTPGRARRLRDRLAARGLFCFTLNAFPFEHFHEPSVKRAVYRPSWLEPARAAYTLDAAAALAALLPDDLAYGTVSTLPIGWRADLVPAGRAGEQRAIDALLATAAALGRLEATTGKRIQVLLEPEPGCVLETTAEAIAWFARLRESARAQGAGAAGGATGAQGAGAAGGATGAEGAGGSDPVLRHLGVCFDCCHQAVMGEPPGEALRALRAASVPVGKLHLSGALEGPLEALGRFVEPRYLHQTVAVDAGGNADAGRPCGLRADDLPDALADPAFAGRRVRTHFHVPIHRPVHAGGLGTTAGSLGAALDEALAGPQLPHLEVETYTWAVLPDAPGDRAQGIAAELLHALALCAARGFA